MAKRKRTNNAGIGDYEIMDDSDVERIISQVEKRYGKSRTEFAGRNAAYRHILLDQFIYGDRLQREQREAEGKRSSISAKQDLKLKIGFYAYKRYGRVDEYTLRATRKLIEKGVKP